MQSTSTTYKNLLNNINHTFGVRLNIGGTIYGEDAIFSAKASSRLFDTEPAIGGTYSNTFEFSVILPSGTNVARMATVVPQFRAEAGGTTSTWYTYGTYFIDTREVSQNDSGLTVLKAFCYDAMLKANADYGTSSLSWPATDTTVVGEIATKMGITVDSRTTALMNKGYTIPTVPIGYTLRDILSYIAVMYGGNWIITPANKLRLVPIAGGTDTLAVGKSSSNLTVSPTRPAYTKLQVSVSEDTDAVIESGSSDDTVMTAVCPFITQAIVNTVFTSLSAFQYKPFTANGVWSDPAVELGDIVTINGFTAPVMAIDTSFGSGMVMGLSAPNDNYIDHEYAYESPTSRSYKKTMGQMSTAIEQNEEAVRITAEKLSNIGGRNYAWAVSEEYHPDLFRAQNCTYTYNPENNGEYVLTSQGGTAFPQIWHRGRSTTGYPVPDELKGTKVTWHCDYINASGADPSPRAYIGFRKNNADQYILSLNPERLSYTFTVPSDCEKMYVLLRVRQDGTNINGETMTVRGLKLEKGEVATDWTPAPEDDTDAISSLSGKVDIQAGKVALVVEEKNGTNVIKTASIVTAINDDSSVTINGNRINLEGAVTISSLDDAAQAALITGTTTKMQYYLSTSASSATGGTWYDSPNSLTWSSGKYIWTRVATTKTYASGTSTTSYSTAVYDKQLTTALSTANTAKSTANGALSSTVSCYYRSTSSTAPAKPTSAVTGTSQDTDNAWTLLMPRPKKSRYYYTCEQYTKNDGTVSWSTVRSVANANYTAMWCSASDQSYIDGGAIYANSVTAEKINVSDLSAFNATIGGWSIGSDEISKTWSGSLLTHKAGISAPATPDNNSPAFYVSATVGDATTYPFRVNYDGKLIATSAEIEGTITSNNANITGGTINIESTVVGTNRIQLKDPFVTMRLDAEGIYFKEASNTGTGIYDGVAAYFEAVGSSFGITRSQIYLSAKYDENTMASRVRLSNSELSFVRMHETNFAYLNSQYLRFDGSNQETLIEVNADTGKISVSDGTNTGYITNTALHLTDGTKTYNFSTTNGLFMYAGSNKYSALIWPDSNGAGRLVLGDGTSTKWRTELTNSGLVFRNASDAVMAQYPAAGWNTTTINGSSTQEAIGTDWTASNIVTYTVPTSGWYILSAYLAYSNGRPRGVMIVRHTSLRQILAVSESTANSLDGGTVSTISASYAGYLSAGESIVVYGKSATASSNYMRLIVHGPIA